MSNLYVFDVNTFSLEDAMIAKNISKEDKVVFLPNCNGLISYILIPHIMEWNTVPSFMVPTSEPMDVAALTFLLGMQSANGNGILYLVVKDNPFSSLDGYSFETEVGTVEIKTFDSLDEVFKSNNKFDDKAEPEKKQPPKKSVEKGNKEYIGSADDNDYPPASEEFKMQIEMISSASNLDLTPCVNALQEVVKENSEGVLSSLEFQVGLRIKAKYVKEVCDALEPHIENLLKTVNK